jgi:serine protease Do
MKKIVIIQLVVAIFFSYAINAYAESKQVPTAKEQVVFSYAPLVKKVSPAVVNIYTKKKVKVQSGFSPFMNDPLFQNFFGNVPGGVITERVENSLGSGVIVKDDGLIITNNHVINGSTDVRVVLHNKREFDAKIIMSDSKTDLALLKIDAGEKLPYLESMDSDQLEVGDMVLAIGNPFGVGQTVTGGIVSALARASAGLSDYEVYIQTDAAINPGNSGGALVNMDGKLAGINTAIFSKSGGSHGIGFAIPSNMVTAILNSKGGKIVRPWLGISTQGMTADIATSLGLKAPIGALVSEVIRGGPADKAGFRVGDVITYVAGHEVEDEHALGFRIATIAIGSDAKFKILRAGSEKEISVRMEVAPETTMRDLQKLVGHNILSGATIANISPALADELDIHGVEKGVIIISVEGGNAAALGVQKGDLLLQINGNAVTSAKQAAKMLANQKISKWQITLQRGSQLLNLMYSGGF